MRADTINNQVFAPIIKIKDDVLRGVARRLPPWLTPNLITALRIALVIPVYFLYREGYIFWAATVFVVALLSDALDGIQARRLNMETTVGKLLDPAADKILVITLFLMTAPGRIADVLIYTIIGLEASLVLLAVVIGPLVQRWMSRKPKVGANNAGKIKMALESMGVLILFIFRSSAMAAMIASVLLWIAAGFALLSIILHLFLREKTPSATTH